MMQIPLKELSQDAGLQMRSAGVDPGTVADYAEAMEGGAVFPPIIVFSDGITYWPCDGFHRIAAANKVGLANILADVRQGNRRDAVLFAVGANASHGLRRSPDDKRRAVVAMLQDPEWSAWSDREIGKRCAVDHKTVGKVRRDLTGDAPTERTYTTKHGTVAQMKVPASAEPSAGSMVSRLLAKASDELLVAECLRRGLEVRYAA